VIEVDKKWSRSRSRYLKSEWW